MSFSITLPSRNRVTGRPLGVCNSRVGSTPRQLEHRRRHVVGRQASADRRHAAGVGAAVDVSFANAAAGQEHGHRPRPVVATRLAVDPRRPAELAGAVHHRRVQQAAAGPGRAIRAAICGRAAAAVGRGSVRKLPACVSQPPRPTVTNRTPALISRRAASAPWPNRSGRTSRAPTPARGRRSKAVAGPVGAEDVQRLLLELVQAGRHVGRVQRLKRASKASRSLLRSARSAREKSSGRPTPCTRSLPRAGRPRPRTGRRPPEIAGAAREGVVWRLGEGDVGRHARRRGQQPRRQRPERGVVQRRRRHVAGRDVTRGRRRARGCCGAASGPGRSGPSPSPSAAGARRSGRP